MGGVRNWFLGRVFLGNGVWDGVSRAWMECPLAELMGTPARDCDNNNKYTGL